MIYETLCGPLEIPGGPLVAHLDRGGNHCCNLIFDEIVEDFGTFHVFFSPMLTNQTLPFL